MYPRTRQHHHSCIVYLAASIESSWYGRFVIGRKNVMSGGSEDKNC